MKLNPISQSIVDKYSKNNLSFIDKLPEGIVFYPGMPGKEKLLSKMNSQIMENIKEKLRDGNTSEEKKELEEKIRVFNEAEKANEKAMELQEAIIFTEKAAESFFEMKNLLKQGKEEEIPKLIQSLYNSKNNLGNLLHPVVKARTPEQPTPIEGSEARGRTTNLLEKAVELKQSLEQIKNLVREKKDPAENLSQEIDDSMTFLRRAIRTWDDEERRLENAIKHANLFLSSVNKEQENITENDEDEQEDDSNTEVFQKNIKSKFADDKEEMGKKKDQITKLEKEITTQENEIKKLETEEKTLKEIPRKERNKLQKDRINEISKLLGFLRKSIKENTITKNKLTEEVTEKLNKLEAKKEILEQTRKENDNKVKELTQEEMDTTDPDNVAATGIEKRLVLDAIKNINLDINELDEILYTYGSADEEDSDSKKETSEGYFSNSTTLKPFKKQIAV